MSARDIFRSLALNARTLLSGSREVSSALSQYKRVREIRTQQELLVASLQDASNLAYLRYKGGVDTLLNALVVDTNLRRRANPRANETR
ncbi:MAG: outer membrane protein multidrug efflux system [Acidobacteriota bacterium]|jgi:outer membrane protein TolC